jgi:hypothetical protein
MNTLPVRLLFLIKDCVFVLRQHLLLPGHFLVPSLHSLCSLALSGESCGNGVDYSIDGAEALALAGLLGLRDAPWDFPRRMLVLRGWGWW